MALMAALGEPHLFEGERPLMEAAIRSVRHYLEFGATIDKSRLTVLQGPVLASDDPEYEDLDGNAVRVPRQFWKIVVRVENDTPKAVAFLASHEKLLKRKRAFLDEDKDNAPPPDVDEFMTSIARIEKLTKLDLRKLRPHDAFIGVRGGPEGAEAAEVRRIRDWDDLP